MPAMRVSQAGVEGTCYAGDAGDEGVQRWSGNALLYRVTISLGTSTPHPCQGAAVHCIIEVTLYPR